MQVVQQYVEASCIKFNILHVKLNKNVRPFNINLTKKFMFRWPKHLSQSFAKKINTSYIKVQSVDSF